MISILTLSVPVTGRVRVLGDGALRSLIRPHESRVVAAHWPGQATTSLAVIHLPYPGYLCYLT